MAIHFTTRIDGALLRVEAHGFDESLEEVMAYGSALIEQCLTHQLTRVLCDERALEYRLNTLDTYALATWISEQVPHLARIALVSAPAAAADAQFWENVAVNRGLTVRAFQDPAAAEHWLCER